MTDTPAASQLFLLDAGTGHLLVILNDGYRFGKDNGKNAIRTRLAKSRRSDLFAVQAVRNEGSPPEIEIWTATSKRPRIRLHVSSKQKLKAITDDGSLVLGYEETRDGDALLLRDAPTSQTL